MHRIESLFLAFCGLVLFTLVMRPATEKFLMRIFSGWSRGFLTSLLLPRPAAVWSAWSTLHGHTSRFGEEHPDYRTVQTAVPN
jgi:hypothetical protein